jgi:hypothetical protein
MHSIKHRFAACALICLLAVTAKAQIAYFGTPVTFADPGNGTWSRYHFDFTTGSFTTYTEFGANVAPVGSVFRFTVFNHSTDGNRTGVQIEFADANAKAVASGGNLSNLSLGASVSSSTATSSASGAYIDWTSVSDGPDGPESFHSGVFTANNPGYMGFSFTTGGSTYYGWAQITVASDSTGLAINQWAYNTVPGAAITVGQGVSAIPEPSTYAALAGLVALGTTVVVRRRRGAAATAA